MFFLLPHLFDFRISDIGKSLKKAAPLITEKFQLGVEAQFARMLLAVVVLFYISWTGLMVSYGGTYAYLGSKSATLSSMWCVWKDATCTDHTGSVVHTTYMVIGATNHDVHLYILIQSSKVHISAYTLHYITMSPCSLLHSSIPLSVLARSMLHSSSVLWDRSSCVLLLLTMKLWLKVTSQQCDLHCF